MDPPTFFDGGVRFECTKCGACCTGEPGTISVDDAEIEALVRLLGVSRPEFTRECLRPTAQGFSIRERDNGDCVFLRDSVCAVHEMRPRQCRTYPFWFKNLRSAERWSRTCSECPGIGQGRLHSRDEILSLVHEEMDRRGIPASES